jgi:hypothetical protein
MISSSVISCKKAISVIKEDYVQIPTQKSRIPCFRPEVLVKRPDAHQSVTFIRTKWQNHPDFH